MKRFTVPAAVLFLLAPAISKGSDMASPTGGGAVQDKTSLVISAAGSQPSIKGPAEYFTGSVRIDPLFSPKESASFSGGYVTFEPGARSAWHTHPAGQHLVVTTGAGWTQVWGGPVVEIHPGDVIWCPPGVKHWHGATPTSAMSHIALTGTIDGKNVAWMEKVTEEQYRK